MPFRSEGLDDLRRRIDIVQVVQRTVPLRRQGQRLVGLCPFHGEKSPSFSVSPERGLFYCFGCHAGGDAIDFVMRRDSLSFHEAAELLAAEFGVTLRFAAGDDAEAASRQESRTRALRLLGEAQAQFLRFLRAPEGLPAQRYLERRGISEQDFERFDLGWAPGGSALGRALGAKPEHLVEAGLMQVGEGGRTYDRFRDRVTFAIRDRSGRVVGFGARTLGDAQPKYLNSAESPLFQKRTILYAWPWAQKEMQEKAAVTVVEGYMDAIALHRAGFLATVATLGTALTEEHAKQIARVARRAFLAYDSDGAGQAAVHRGMEPLLRAGLEVLVVTPDGGKDPDEVIAAQGPQAWEAALGQAKPIAQHLFEEAAKEHGLASPSAKARVSEAVFVALRAMPNVLVRDEELRRLAQRLSVREETLRQEFQRGQTGGDRTHRLETTRNSTRNTPEPRSLWRVLELGLLSLLAQHPEAVKEVRENCRPLHENDCEQVLELLAQGGDPGQAEDERLRLVWAEATLAEPVPREEVKKNVVRWVKAGKQARLNEVQRIMVQMQDQGTPIDPSLLVEAKQLMAEIGAQGR